MSTRSALPRQSHDHAELLALVARAKRRALLRAHRHRLRPEDLEDCYSQATLELLAALARGRRFSGRTHLVHALEQRFRSRVDDRRRALHGRSALAAALEHALPLGLQTESHHQLADPRADIHPHVVRRAELRRVVAVSGQLTPDQRLVLAHQLADGTRADFCARFGWSPEKYRKVAQRARARLRALCDGDSLATHTTGARPSHPARQCRNKPTGMHS